MKKMLPESELARDERFVRTNIGDRIFDPRGAKVAMRNTGPAKMAIDRPAAGERSRSLMHGIFVGEIQALEGAGRTCYDFDLEDAVLDLGAHEPLVASELGLGEELLHPTVTSSEGAPRLPGPVIPPDATYRFSNS